MRRREINIIRFVQIILILLFCVASFAPCIIEEHMPIFPTKFTEFAGGKRITFRDYASHFCVILSALELLLLFLSKRQWSKIVRLILSLTKIIAPLPMLDFLNKLFERIGMETVSYRLNWIAYPIMGIGLLEVLCNMLDIISQKERVECETSGIHCSEDIQ